MKFSKAPRLMLCRAVVPSFLIVGWSTMTVHSSAITTTGSEATSAAAPDFIRPG